MRTSDEWFGLVLTPAVLAVVGIITLIPNENLAWLARLEIDYVLAVGYVAGSIIYFRHLREPDPAKISERSKQIADYHHQVRQLVLVPWIQDIEKWPFPFVATSEVSVRPVFQAPRPAYERQFKSALQHLETYGLSKERENLLSGIEQHNRKVKENETKDGQSPLIRQGSVEYHVERDKLAKDQTKIWTSVSSFKERLQEVVSDLEVGRLNGECDFEKELRKSGS